MPAVLIFEMHACDVNAIFYLFLFISILAMMIQ